MKTCLFNVCKIQRKLIVSEIIFIGMKMIPLEFVKKSECRCSFIFILLLSFPGEVPLQINKILVGVSENYNRAVQCVCKKHKTSKQSSSERHASYRGGSIISQSVNFSLPSHCYKFLNRK